MAETVKKFLDYEGLQYIVSKLLAGDVQGKGLSTNDLTDALVAKINSTATSEGLNEINTRLAEIESLIESDKDGAINKFNEIVAFLTGVADTKTLDGLLADIATQIGGKVDKETGKGLSTNDYTTAEKNKLAAIEAGAQKNTVTSVAGKTGVVVLAKADVGLANVDNTSDLKKPVSEATQAALDLKVDAVTGKGLSTNDYTIADKEKLTATAEMVDKVLGDWDTALEGVLADKKLTEVLTVINEDVTLLNGRADKARHDIDLKLDAADLVAVTTAEIDALIAVE